MKSTERALSVELSGESTMRILQEEANIAEWAAEQVRKGATIPPDVQARLFQSHYHSCTAMRADRLLISTMVCEMARDIARLEARLNALPPAPWWRRWLRFAARP